MISAIRNALRGIVLKLPVIRYLGLQINELKECYERIENREAELNGCLAAIRETLSKHESVLGTESLIGLPEEVLRAQIMSGRSDNFFKHLEYQYRGSFEQTVRSMECYSGFLDSMPKGAVAVDLGCGRGEWLSVLLAHGVKGIGVDINEEKVAEAKEQGFESECADAVSFLRTLDAGVALVTMFHVVEHLPLNYLIAVVDLAYSKLAEDGVLLMEMPNIRNPDVASYGFFMDPSHRKPIPPHLLAFIAQNSGFADTEIIFLGKNGNDGDGQRLIVDEQEGVTSCPDVAIIARKKGAGIGGNEKNSRN